MARKTKSAGGGLRSIDASASDVFVSPPADTIARIRYWHRQRCFAMEQRKRLDLALGSFLRLMLGWRKDLPDAERKAIAERAAALIDDAAGSEWETVIAASTATSAPFDAIESRAVKEMSALAVSLPAWPAFGDAVRGFGPASLAVIVAEAGDLSLYANPGKLWKRMGLAVMGDVRQGGLGANASKEAWIAHGYNRQRRSRMWNIGDALIKGNRDGEYRTVYLQRKEYELARDPEMKPIKAHRRAQRYMEKRLLRNLWSAWRRAAATASTIRNLPAAIPSAQAERSASCCQEPISGLPSAPTPAKAGKRRATRPVKTSGALPAATNRAKARRSANASLASPIGLPSANITELAGDA